jgi:Ca-activated chloride channel family protein
MQRQTPTRSAFAPAVPAGTAADSGCAHFDLAAWRAAEGADLDGQMPAQAGGRRRVRSPRPARAGLRICAWLALIVSTTAASQDPVAGADGLMVRGSGGDWRRSVALDTQVDFRIRGLLAEVAVQQTYRNDSGEWLEGRYLLPLPGDGAVGRLRLQIGQRLIEGEVQEKQAAQAAYQAAAAAGQGAALVERQRANLFSTAVANIGPGETVRIEIGYWQAVRWQDGAFSIGLPLTLVAPYHGGSGEPGAGLDAPVQLPTAVAAAIDLGEAFEPTVSLDIDLDAGLPLASVTSPTHAIRVEPRGRGHHVRLEHWVEASDRDFELRWTPVASTAPQQALFTEQVDGEHYALLMLVPPTVPVPPVPRELIVVVDNSGSMQGASMVQAKAAVDRALSRLHPGDRFNVIRFDDSTEAVFPAPVPADAGHLAQARRFVQGLSADGGTELYPALELAFAQAPSSGHLRQLVLITDAGIGNEQQLLRLVETGRGDARVFAVGIGSAPNAHFLRRAAELGRGTDVLVRDLAEVDARIDALLAKLGAPVLRDLALAWPGPAEVYPERLPDLYAGEPLQVLARLPALHGQLKAQGLGQRQRWQDSVALGSAQSVDGRGVARLWANARITALDDSLRAGADPALVRAQTLEVALKHQLVSAYTALVAIERTPIRPLDLDLASVGFANAAPAGSVAFAQGSTPARMRLAAALALALLALLVLGRRTRSVVAGTDGGVGRLARRLAAED